MKSTLLFLAAVAICLVACQAQAQQPIPKRLNWWADARFGMFIHWGPVSLSEQEISWSRANTNPQCPNNGPISAEEYDNLYKRFDPVKFDAKEWVRIAKAAGMKYMVLTAKHCDGFLLWDSKVSDYNIMHTPFKRDVCKELADAAHAAGMRIGWYFSPMDWKDPDCRNAGNAEFVKRMQAEIRELLTNYGRIDVLWFDCDGGTVPWDQAGTYALVKKLQPNIVIDNRLDAGPGFNVAEPAGVGPNADYFTPEQWIGGYCDSKPWESCMTVSKKNQWSWAGHSDGVKSLDECLAMLIGCAGGDGNVLLDVGPMPDGEIAPEQTALLMEVGKWYSAYGKAIGGTRGGPYKPGEYGTCTRKGNTVYVHIRNWDAGFVQLPPLPAKVVKHYVLGGGEAKLLETAKGLVIQVPEQYRKDHDTVVAIELDKSAIGIPAIDVPGAPSLTAGATATASNVFQNDPQYAAGKAVDGNEGTRWATDGGTHSAWLEVDLGSPKTFNRAIVVQAFPELERIRGYSIEYWEDGVWKPCYTGGLMPPRVSASFPKVTAQKVRLNITEATDGPTIWEFKLFGPEVVLPSSK